jgi:general stress protein CsbA
MKVFNSIVQGLRWVQIFIAHVIICSIIALLTYENNKTIAIILLVIGIIGGVVMAELVRRKYGLSNFFSRLYSNETDNKPSK